MNCHTTYSSYNRETCSTASMIQMGAMYKINFNGLG